MNLVCQCKALCSLLPMPTHEPDDSRYVFQSELRGDTMHYTIAVPLSAKQTRVIATASSAAVVNYTVTGPHAKRRFWTLVLASACGIANARGELDLALQLERLAKELGLISR